MKKELITFNKFSFLILIATFFMSIGYAAINLITLDIKGTVMAKPKEEIAIINAYLSDSLNANVENSNVNYSETLLNNRIELSSVDASSYVTYTVTIKNNTINDYAFDGSKYDETFYDNPNITFELIGLNENDIIKSKESVTFDITFKYKNDEVSINNVLNSYIDFDFKEFFTITYENIVNNNYPAQIVEGGNLSVTFSPGVDEVIVYMDDVVTTNFTYENNLLTILNVTGNLKIEGVDCSDIDFVIKDDSNTLNTEQISPSNPSTVTNLLTMEFSGKNLSQNYINQIDVTLEYTSKTGSEQIINCVLEYNGKTFIKPITFLGQKKNVMTTPVSFTYDDINLGIKPGDDFRVYLQDSSLTNKNVSITQLIIAVNFAS